MKEIKDLKLMEISKLRELDEKNLRKELSSTGRKSFELKMKLNVGELKQTHLIKALRKYIAILNAIATTKGFNIN